MPISEAFRHYSQVLSNIHVESQSVDFVEGKLVEAKKRSMLQNFWSWFIHLISCTRVPRNAKLDEVTGRILQDAGEIKPQDIASEAEKAF
ncbi:MAG: hypothetical protein HWD61_06970 [Parachlamydiaceae bacterium]|nr:MAG: hypothetical protein HWD61_06970 [Parachlamydiaceae bacterium]